MALSFRKAKRRKIPKSPSSGEESEKYPSNKPENVRFGVEIDVCYFLVFFSFLVV